LIRLRRCLAFSGIACSPLDRTPGGWINEPPGAALVCSCPVLSFLLEASDELRLTRSGNVPVRDAAVMRSGIRAVGVLHDPPADPLGHLRHDGIP
jgi:hypothetical protein